MNCIIEIGNLTRDPECKTMNNGKPRTMFTLAVNREYLNAQGKRDADYITFVAYEKNAELVARYLTKGRKCAVRGHVKTGSYEKDGKRIYTTEFVADKIEFLSPFNAGQAGATEAPESSSEAPGMTPTYGGYPDYEDDELPF